MQTKYLASIRSGILQQMTERSQLAGRVAMYLVIVYLYSQIFRDPQIPSYQLWYAGMTQVVSMSTSLIAFQIAQDMQNGQIAHFLIRPIHYVGYRISEGLGISLVRYFILISIYLFIHWMATDTIPDRLILGIFFGLAGVFLSTLISVLIGLSSFWIRDIKQLFFLNLTASFCFGGLLVSLDYYPPLARAISFCTPYPWILWWPAEWMVGLTSNLLLGLACWSLWTVFFGAIIFLVYNKCVKSFVMEGA